MSMLLIDKSILLNSYMYNFIFSPAFDYLILNLMNKIVNYS